MNTAERIYIASTCDGEPAGRLAEALARRIEDDIAHFGLAPDASLGSLRELEERYRAGRSAVREAVGLLERRGLGRLRPGPCGGFILSRPSPETIGASLADHFLLGGITAAWRRKSNARGLPVRGWARSGTCVSASVSAGSHFDRPFGSCRTAGWWNADADVETVLSSETGASAAASA